PDGKYFAQSTLGGTVNVWSLGNPKPVVAQWSLPRAKRMPATPWLEHDDALQSHFLIGGDRLLTVSAAGSVEIWKLPGMQSVRRIAGPGPNKFQAPRHAAISPDRRKCAVFTQTNFRIVDTASGKFVKTESLPPPEDLKQPYTVQLAFNPIGSRLLVA